MAYIILLFALTDYIIRKLQTGFSGFNCALLRNGDEAGTKYTYEYVAKNFPENFGRNKSRNLSNWGMIDKIKLTMMKLLWSGHDKIGSIYGIINTHSSENLMVVAWVETGIRCFWLVSLHCYEIGDKNHFNESSKRKKDKLVKWNVEKLMQLLSSCNKLEHYIKYCWWLQVILLIHLELLKMRMRQCSGKCPKADAYSSG